MAKKILLKDFILLTGNLDSKPQKLNIEIEADKIKRIGNFKEADDYQEIVKGEKDYIAPGFIDMHSHADLMNFSNQGLKAKISQGVTTEVTGQCGLGPAPVTAAIKNSWQKKMIIRNPLSDFNWNSVEEFFETLKKTGLENNLVYFIPHGLLRYLIKRDSKTKMNKNELKKLRKILRESLQAGAAGLSFGLCYFPAVYADYEELKTIFEVVAAENKLISVHLKSEGSKIIESLQEIVKLKNETKARVNISHLKILGEENQTKLKKVFEIITKNNLSFDSYPYNFGSTTLEVIIPPVYLEGENLAILKDKKVKAELKELYATGKNPYDNWDNLPYLLGWDNIYLSGLTAKKHKKFNGLSIKKIADKLDLDPVETAFKFLLEADNFLMQDYYMKEEVIEKILKNSNGNIGTDSLFSKANPHPRTSSTYIKILKKYVFQKELISLTEAIYKFSKNPAQTLPLSDRGEIAVAKKADLVIISKEDLLSDNAKNGIKSVMINGKWKLKDYNYLKDSKPGELIKFESIAKN